MKIRLAQNQTQCNWNSFRMWDGFQRDKDACSCTLSTTIRCLKYLVTVWSTETVRGALWTILSRLFKDAFKYCPQSCAGTKTWSESGKLRRLIEFVIFNEIILILKNFLSKLPSWNSYLLHPKIKFNCSNIFLKGRKFIKGAKNKK